MPKMTSLQIRDQIKSLEKQVSQLKAAEVKDVVARIKQAIEYYELTPRDLFTAAALSKADRAPKAKQAGAVESTFGSASPARKTTKGLKVAPKYRDLNGNTWSGRGTMPRWLAAEVAAGKTLQDFAV